MLKDCADPACAGNAACHTGCTDADGDGYCAQSGIGTIVDCNDGNAGIHPGAMDVCEDGIDHDCDGKDCDLIYTNRLGMNFKRISAGTFMMGSPEDELGREDDEILHQVTLTHDYYMQTTEVTQGQWKTVLGNNPSYFASCGDNCPVENISWNEIQNFLAQINKMGEGTYRLPTEAEWEYAARAGSDKAFANGDISAASSSCDNDPNLDAIGFYCGNSCVSYAGGYDCSATSSCSTCGTNPVSQKTPNDFGIYDMHGNVSEWCQDWYGDYPAESVSDPAGSDTGTERVVRGGSWIDDAGSLRAANRNKEAPSAEDIGFRLVVIPSEAK